MRGDTGKPGSDDGPDEAAAEAVVAPLPVGRVLVPTGEHERFRVVGQRGEVLFGEPQDERRDGQPRRWWFFGVSMTGPPDSSLTASATMIRPSAKSR